MRRSRWTRVSGCFLAVAVLALVAAAQSGAVVVYGPSGKFFGVAPAAHPSLRRASPLLSGTEEEESPSPLSYHGGTVLHNNQTYAIYWDPSGLYPSSTRENLDRYFSDVAAASGTTSNAYSVTTQYTDATGAAAYSSSFGGAFTDHDSYPTHGNCTDPNGGAGPCITDAQLSTELAAFIAREHLPASGNAIYFVFFPEHTVTCLDGGGTGGHCSDNFYCAYHSHTAANVLYADIPFETDKKGCQNDGTAKAQEPNGDISDLILKYVSHEHIETITDPYGSGWIDNTPDRQGFKDEIGDKCNGIEQSSRAFTPTLGGEAEAGTLFNQEINGRNYYLQSEWSNIGEHCDMHLKLFQPEDVFIGVDNGQIQWRQPDGSLNETLQTGISSFTTGMAFDRVGNLYVTDFGASNVSRFNPLGELVGTFGSGYSSLSESIVFNKAGDAYVGSADGNVVEIDPNGNFVQEFPTGRSDWIDLAADQCTLYYTDEGEFGGILRYNVCTNEPLPEFVARSGVEHPYALRLLPSGGLLVADTSVIRRFDHEGNLVQTYSYPGNSAWFALNLDPDGTSFYSADFETSSVVKFDIASGQPLLAYNTGTPFQTVYGILVDGELTVGAGAEIFGTVKQGNGSAVAGALIQACPTGGGSCFETTSLSGGAYRLSGLSPGEYDLTAFPPAGSNLAQAGFGPVHLGAGATQPENFVLLEPGAPPGNVSISPIRTTINGIPVVDFGRVFSLSITGCPRGTATYEVSPYLHFLTGTAEGNLAESPEGSGSYATSITPAVTWFGPANVTIHLLCPGGKHDDTTFTLYIDPSGTVVTDEGVPVPGAAVTLYRGEGPLGPFTQVPNESPIMSPMNRSNPDTTQSDGSFGWDVIGGYYKIRAEREGCYEPGSPSVRYVESEVLTIPPSIAGLKLTLHCISDSTTTSTTAATNSGSGAGPKSGVLGVTATGPTAPIVSGLAIAPHVFRAARSGASIAVTRGATVSYRDSQTATTTFRVSRAERGVRRGTRCIPTRYAKAHSRKRCTRYVLLGTFTHVDALGANRLHFTGRIRFHPLPPDEYQLQAVSRGSAGLLSKPLAVSFTILR
jgi:hypothetical protein